MCKWEGGGSPNFFAIRNNLFLLNKRGIRARVTERESRKNIKHT